MNVYEAVANRHSIRRYKDVAVPYEILEKCVNAARLAPTGRNRQLCEFVIVDEEQLVSTTFNSIASWGGKSPGETPPEHAPKAFIVTLINKELEAELAGGRGITVYHDAGIAVANMILVALEEGIGTCPILSFKENEWKQILNIPDKYDIDIVLALGYPDESPVTEVSKGPIEYRVDSQGVRHVSKRNLEDIRHRNKFP